jgi:hypothetical protein
MFDELYADDRRNTQTLETNMAAVNSEALVSCYVIDRHEVPTSTAFLRDRQHEWTECPPALAYIAYTPDAVD